MISTRVFRRLLATTALVCLAGPVIAQGARSHAVGDSDSHPGNRPENPDRPTIGVALAGGGAKGCAHIGVLQVFEEMGIPVDYVAGTSMGSVIGGLYATGYSADSLAELVTEIDWTRAMRDKPPRSELAFRRKQDDLRYPLDLELGLKDGQVVWPRGLSAGQNLFLLLRNLTLPVQDIDDFDRLPVPFRAIAADVQTGERVALQSGDLAKVIRASMAIPGYFTPVTIDERTYIDGGVIDNLPIDEVRAMGADIVIAINLGNTLVENETQTLTQILGQTTSMLTRRNVDPQLERADLVINPQVSDFGLLNFQVAREIIEAGALAARSQVEELKEYAYVDPYRAVERRPIPEAVTVDAVVIEGESRVDRRIIEADVPIPANQDIDFEALQAGITRLYGLGDFESIEFDLRPNSQGRRDLVLRLRDKSWGPNYLRFGLQLEADQDGEALTVTTNYTATRLNALGAEWRNDFIIGSDLGFSSEIYQPLDVRGGWFVSGQVDFAQQRSGFFIDGFEVADLEIRQAGVNLDLGHQFGEYGEIRLGLERGRAEVSVATGDPLLTAGDLDEADFGAVVLEATLDRLDQSMLPTDGAFIDLRLFRAEEDLGADDAYSKFSVDSAFFRSWGPHTLISGLSGGWSPGGDLPFYDLFRVGGLLSFSGFSEDELRGQEFGVARLGYLRELSSGGTLIRRVMAGGWLEAGRVWTEGEDPSLDDLEYALTVSVGAETLIGPVYLAYGHAEEGSGRLYIIVGRNF
ncbi:MAG: patatin-like phospholipase family protein [Acidobacteriota bacterium]